MVSKDVTITPDRPRIGQVGLADYPDTIKFDSKALNFPEIRTEDINRMMRIDGQIGGLYRLLTIPLRGSQVEIQRPNRRSNRETDFIENVLTRPYVEGGMVTQLETVVSTILRMIIDGWSPHEIVWDIRDGFVHVEKIDYRPISTIVPKLDKNNNLDGYEQDLSRIDPQRGVAGKITIDASKVMHFVNSPEWNPIFGRSSFFQAYYHFEKKHKLYYISHIAAQINALRLRVIKTSEENEDLISKYVDLVSKLGFNSTINLPESVDLELLDTGDNFPDVLPIIQHHDSQMAKSVLAQVMDVGVEGRTGSFNLSDTHFDIFIVNLQLMGNYIANVFNSVLIPKLIDWNFGTGYYPKIKFHPFDRQIKKQLFEVYIRLISAANLNVTPEFVLEIESAVAKTIGLNVEYANIEEYVEIFKEKMQAETKDESDQGTGDTDGRDRSGRTV